MSPRKYAESLVTKSLQCGEVYYEYVFAAVFTEELHESIRYSMRSYRSTQAGAKLYDPARHSTIFRGLKKVTDFYSDKSSDRRRSAKHRRGRRWSSADIVNVVYHTEANSTLTTSTTPKSNALAATLTGLSPQLEQTTVTPSSSGSTQTPADQA